MGGFDGPQSTLLIYLLLFCSLIHLYHLVGVVVVVHHLDALGQGHVADCELAAQTIVDPFPEEVQKMYCITIKTPLKTRKMRRDVK